MTKDITMRIALTSLYLVDIMMSFNRKRSFMNFLKDIQEGQSDIIGGRRLEFCWRMRPNCMNSFMC